MNRSMICRKDVERMMLVAHDTKKEFHYLKDRGEWCWTSRGEPLRSDAQSWPTFLDCLADAVEPYLDLEPE